VAGWPKSELISQREYARRRGVSHTAVQQAIASGRISTVHGKIDPAMADRQWQQNTDQSKPRNRITGQPKHRRAPDGLPQPMRLLATVGADGEDGAAIGYTRARAARELYQAQLAKMELDRQRAALVRADEVKVGAFNMARMAREKLTALPERVATVIAAARVPEEVQRILEEEIERVCREISDANRA
jgi:hypothetical protein